MITEREHWLSITGDTNWKRNHIADPNISEGETIAAIVSAFPDNPSRILEIGCGYGRLASQIAHWFPNAVVTGIDINPAVLEHGLPGPQYFCTDSLVTFTAQDAIYSLAVFQHLPADEKEAYIHQAYEALRPGGVLRLQFIAGTRDNFCDHWAPWPCMLHWVYEAGFNTVATENGWAHPQWSWITAVK